MTWSWTWLLWHVFPPSRALRNWSLLPSVPSVLASNWWRPLENSPSSCLTTTACACSHYLPPFLLAIIQCSALCAAGNGLAEFNAWWPSKAVDLSVCVCVCVCAALLGVKTPLQLQTANLPAQAQKKVNTLIFLSLVFCFALVFSQGKTPWVDSACADCPGFLVLSAAPAAASTFVSDPQIVPPG